MSDENQNQPEINENGKKSPKKGTESPKKGTESPKKGADSNKNDDFSAAAPAQDDSDDLTLDEIQIEDIKKMPVFLKQQFKQLMDEMR